jgi:hypothetical protein
MVTKKSVNYYRLGRGPVMDNGGRQAGHGLLPSCYSKPCNTVSCTRRTLLLAAALPLPGRQRPECSNERLALLGHREYFDRLAAAGTARHRGLITCRIPGLAATQRGHEPPAPSTPWVELHDAAARLHEQQQVRQLRCARAGSKISTSVPLSSRTCAHRHSSPNVLCLIFYIDFKYSYYFKYEKKKYNVAYYVMYFKCILEFFIFEIF